MGIKIKEDKEKEKEPPNFKIWKSTELPTSIRSQKLT